MPSVDGMNDRALHVALLRGINLGGKNKLPMKELAAIFTEHGASDVRTYIQSGNVVFRAARAKVARLPELVGAGIEARFGHRPPIVLRTSDEMSGVLETNPFLADGADPDALHVAFLDVAPPAAKIAALDPKRSATDRFVVRGREIYLHTPNGIGRSKLTNAYFDSKLGATSTVRNWRTVRELVRLCSSE